MEEVTEKNFFSVVDMAKKNNIKIKTYEEFLKTSEAEEYAISEEELKYYKEKWAEEDGKCVWCKRYCYDSIVKCDDVIYIDKNEITRKIGEVGNEDLIKFINKQSKKKELPKEVKEIIKKK